ncbi:MAG: S4 domain-containing protein [Erysipelotrichaceae bacterium]|nr:S4 domain-containing protein [Erysipelotrichaceae bacterium]
MRLDKYLKVTRILKRRVIGKELAKNQRIMINGKVAKPSSELKVNDEVEVVFGKRHLLVKVLKVQSYSKKDEADMMYEVLNEFVEE